MRSVYLIVLLAARSWWSGVAEDPEVHLDTAGIIRYHGYPVEEYTVKTEDCYLLDVQRIPHGRNGTRQGGPVVFLQHGLIAASSNWVANLVNESLGFMLADAGFDVWLGNVRGNTYGRRHCTLSPKDIAFWQFSWDEMAKYDLPAMIDFALNVSGKAQLYYVGHSQGTLIAFAELPRNAHLASRVKAFFALAPIMYAEYIRGALKYIAYFYKLGVDIYEVFGEGEFLPSDKLTHLLASELCGSVLAKSLCGDILFAIAGFDQKGMNETRLPVYMSHTPAGTSVQNMAHWGQMVNSGLTIRAYDYGSPEKNVKHYGKNNTRPPVYSLDSLTVPTVLFSGSKDLCADPKDVAILKKRIPSRALVKSIVLDDFDHLDFVWGLEAAKSLYIPMIEMMKAGLDL